MLSTTGEGKTTCDSATAGYDRLEVSYICSGFLGLIVLILCILSMGFNMNDGMKACASALCCLSFISTIAYALTEEVSPAHWMLLAAFAVIIPGCACTLIDVHKNNYHHFLIVWFKKIFPGSHIKWLSSDVAGMPRHVGSDKNLQGLPTHPVHDDLIMDMPCHFSSWLVYCCLQLLTYVGFLLWMAGFSIVWLPVFAVGCLLHQANLMHVSRIRKVWVLCWTGESTATESTPAQDDLNNERVVHIGLACTGLQAAAVIVVRGMNSMVLWNDWDAFCVITGCILLCTVGVGLFASYWLFATRTVHSTQEKVLKRTRDIVDFLNTDNDESDDDSDTESEISLSDRYISSPNENLYYILQVRSQTDLQAQKFMIGYNVCTPSDLSYINRSALFELITLSVNNDKTLMEHCKSIARCIEFKGKPSMVSRFMDFCGVTWLKSQLNPLINWCFPDDVKPPAGQDVAAEKPPDHQDVATDGNASPTLDGVTEGAHSVASEGDIEMGLMLDPARGEFEGDDEAKDSDTVGEWDVDNWWNMDGLLLGNDVV